MIQCNLLNIKDENIHILSNKLESKVIKEKNYMIIEAILTYNLSHCPLCRCINNSHNDIIKWEFRKNCKIKIPKISNCYSMLILRKQRFYCKNCNYTFIAQTSIVDKNKNISNNTELQITMELMEKQSEKDIAKRLDVSVSKIGRKLNEISSHTVLRHANLPKSMNWDDKDTKGKIAFIITDNEKGNIFDINNCRKSKNLEKYFKRFPKSERNKVKLISTDFYSGYIYLAKKLFKNASIVIDRFHIVTQVYVALNSYRVSLCKKDNLHYNKLKDLWKLILKNKNDLSEEKNIPNIFIKKFLKKIWLVL